MIEHVLFVEMGDRGHLYAQFGEWKELTGGQTAAEGNKAWVFQVLGCLFEDAGLSPETLFRQVAYVLR